MGHMDIDAMIQKTKMVSEYEEKLARFRKNVESEIKQVRKQLRAESDDHTRKYLNGKLYALRYVESNLRLVHVGDEMLFWLAEIAHGWALEKAKHEGRLDGMYWALSMIDGSRNGTDPAPKGGGIRMGGM